MLVNPSCRVCVYICRCVLFFIWFTFCHCLPVFYFFKKVYILLPRPIHHFALEKVMALSSGNVWEAYGYDLLYVHAQIEILRKQGPLVSHKVIPLLSFTKWVSIVRAPGWSIFWNALKEREGMIGMWGVAQRPWTGTLQGVRKSIAVFTYKSLLIFNS